MRDRSSVGILRGHFRKLAELPYLDDKVRPGVDDAGEADHPSRRPGQDADAQIDAGQGEGEDAHAELADQEQVERDRIED